MKNKVANKGNSIFYKNVKLGLKPVTKKKSNIKQSNTKSVSIQEREDFREDKLSNTNNIREENSSTRVKNSLTLETKQTQAKQNTSHNISSNIKSSANSMEEKFPNIPKNSELNIYGWNINGIRAMMKNGKLQRFMSSIQPDILCLNETRIDKPTLLDLKYDNLFSDYYLSYWNCSTNKKGYAGVAIFTKYKPINIYYGMEKEEHDEEGRLLTLEYEYFYLVSVYVPNSGSGRLDYRIQQWDLHLREYVSNLKKTNKDIIIVGDMNVAHEKIDVANWHLYEGSSCFTIQERENLTKLLNIGIVDTFRYLNSNTIKYTYFTSENKLKKNMGWRLDYILVNKEAITKVVKADILYDYMSSDHVPVMITWKMNI